MIFQRARESKVRLCCLSLAHLALPVLARPHAFTDIWAWVIVGRGRDWVRGGGLSLGSPGGSFTWLPLPEIRLGSLVLSPLACPECLFGLCPVLGPKP